MVLRFLDVLEHIDGKGLVIQLLFLTCLGFLRETEPVGWGWSPVRGLLRKTFIFLLLLDELLVLVDKLCLLLLNNFLCFIPGVEGGRTRLVSFNLNLCTYFIDIVKVFHFDLDGGFILRNGIFRLVFALFLLTLALGAFGVGRLGLGPLAGS